MRVFANAPGLLPPMARPNESAPSLLRARSALPRTEGMTEAFDDHMRRSLAERALGPVQAKPAIDTGYGDLIAAARAPLQRMPDATGMPTPVRAKMEGALGADFSDVRVHTGSARAVELGALAFTQGSDIHVAPGQWAPETTKGQELLGHELGHVLQQRTGRVKATAQLKGVGLNDEPALEAEADAMGGEGGKGRRRTAAVAGARGRDGAAGASCQGGRGAAGPARHSAKPRVRHGRRRPAIYNG